MAKRARTSSAVDPEAAEREEGVDLMREFVRKFSGASAVNAQSMASEIEDLKKRNKFVAEICRASRAHRRFVTN